VARHNCTTIFAQDGGEGFAPLRCFIDPHQELRHKFLAQFCLNKQKTLAL